MKLEKWRDRVFLNELRTLQCEAAMSLRDCMGQVVPAHLDHNSGKGMGTKGGDQYAGPLCHAHHHQEHRGVRSFWIKVFEQDHWFLMECLRAWRLLRCLRYLEKDNRVDEIRTMIRRF